jgi:hypothetical protein
MRAIAADMEHAGVRLMGRGHAFLREGVRDSEGLREYKPNERQNAAQEARVPAAT